MVLDMDIILKTNNDLKYLIKRSGSNGVKEAINNNLIYRYQNNFYFTQSKFKVEDNLLIQITKLLFKNQFCKEALFLLSPKTFFVNQIRDILKYSYNAYEHYFLGMSLKELNPNNDEFTQVISLPVDLYEKISYLNETEQEEVLKLYDKYLNKIIFLLKNNYPLLIYNIEKVRSNNKVFEIIKLLNNCRRI